MSSSSSTNASRFDLNQTESGDILQVALDPEDEQFFHEHEKAQESPKANKLSSTSSLSQRLNRRSNPPVKITDEMKQGLPAKSSNVAFKAQHRLKGRSNPPIPPSTTAKIARDLNIKTENNGVNKAKELHKRLNLRSRPVESASLNPERFGQRFRTTKPIALPNPPSKVPYHLGSKINAVSKSVPSRSLQSRLGFGASVPPIRVQMGPSGDPNRTPERPRSPSPIFGDEVLAMDSEDGATFNRSLSFSPNTSRSGGIDMNRSMSSEPSSQESDNYQKSVLESESGEAILSGVSTAFVDELITNNPDKEDADEPMEWNEIDPGLLQELQACRQNVLATPNANSALSVMFRKQKSEPDPCAR